MRGMKKGVARRSDVIRSKSGGRLSLGAEGRGW